MGKQARFARMTQGPVICAVDRQYPCGIPGTRLRRDAPGRAYRAGEFISPSEYQMKGVPAEIQRSDFSGERRRGGSADPKQ